METIITSASNPGVKQLRKLATSAKERRASNTYIAEGTHLVRSFLTSGHVPLSYVCAESAPKNSEVLELTEALDAAGVRRTVVADSLFESLANIHASVGILITFSPQLPEASCVSPLTKTAVLLEDVQDPGNLGTILRTTAAVGVRDVILSPGCASPWSPKALRAGMGAQFSLDIHEDMGLADILKSATIPTLITSLAPSGKSLYELDLKQPVAWLLGSEGQGVSESLATQASTQVLIPQAATSVESLNVAAAAAVCLYEQYRQSTFLSKP